MTIAGFESGFEFVRWGLLASIAIYFVFSYFEDRQIKDEREEFIRLKAFELVSRVTTSALLMISIGYFFYPAMNSLIPIFVLILAFLYTEILGKLYFRRKY